MLLSICLNLSTLNILTQSYLPSMPIRTNWSCTIALRSTCSSSVNVSSTLLCITLYLRYQGRGSTFIDTLGMVVLRSPYHLCSPSTYLSISLRLSSIYSANVIVLYILSSYCNCLVTSGQHYNQHHHQDGQCYRFHMLHKLFAGVGQYHALGYI